MELRKIQYFLRIVDEGSMSKAAQSLYLTQPTLSRFLEKLEDELGVALFNRGKNNALTLTEAGYAYLHTARKIDKLWQSLDAELTGYRSEKDRLCFGIHGDYLLPFAAECAKRVMEAYPGVSVSYFSDNSEEVQRQVADGMIRIGLCAYDKKDPRLSYSQCSKVEMNLVVSQKNPLQQCAYNDPGQENCRLKLTQLENVGFAMMRGNTVLRRVAEDYMSHQRFQPNIKQTYLRHGSIVDVISSTDLAGFCPANNKSNALAYIALDPPFYYVQGVCWLKKTAFSPAEKMLIRLLKNIPSQRELD